jgi:hypothetical protein
MPAKRILSAALALLLVGTFAAPSQTSAQNSNNAATHLFWSRTEQGTIARARLDGTEQNLNLISGLGAGGISVLGNYIYWNTGSAIAKSTLSGTSVDAAFISNVEGSIFVGGNLLATDAYLYWNQGDTKIGRANIDGTGQNPDFITGIAGTDDIASDGTYVYWNEYQSNAIGRCKLDGTEVNHTFIDSAMNSGGLTVTASHIYWTNYGTGSIGRANIDGTSKVQDFIPTGASSNPYGIVSDGTYVYWVDGAQNVIGRANLDGSDIQLGFISNANVNADYALALGVIEDVPSTDRDGSLWTTSLVILAGLTAAASIGLRVRGAKRA